jgi:hypothetical protein
MRGARPRARRGPACRASSAPARRCPTTPGRPQARSRGDTPRAFIANLARVGRVDVRRRTRPPSWAANGSGGRRIRGAGLRSPGSLPQIGGGRLLSGPGGLVPPQQPVALKERSPASTAARVAAALNVEGPACAGSRNGWRHRHQLVGCGDRWIAAGQLPAATSSRSCRACRRRGPRRARVARRAQARGWRGRLRSSKASAAAARYARSLLHRSGRVADRESGARTGAEIERSQRGALSAPFPSPPAGPAPCFWR